MAFRELTMMDVKEVLRRWQAEHSERRIAREAGMDRKTVGRYIVAAVELGLPRDGVLGDDQVQAVAQCVQSRLKPNASEQWCEVAKHRHRIEQWLAGKPPLRLSKIHTLLARDGLQASYWTLRRFAVEELGWRKKQPTIRLDDPPAGQEAQVDFGKMGYLIDPETGRKRTLWVLIVTLSFSRYQFVWPTFLQTTEAICEGLDAAWNFFGAMPLTIVPDNMTGIVATADALSPRLCDAFADYAQARGIFVDPARVRCPRDKARVENQVAYVRESWFAGEIFRDLEDARSSAVTWARDVAGCRIHGTTRKVPREVFDEVEKAAMLPPPDGPFDVPLWTTSKVHPDHHIQVARALYSVPTLYLRKEVRVRADKKLVRIYFKNALIKTHPRQLAGGRSTDTSDYPVGKAAYAKRSVEHVVDKARSQGHHVGLYAERILAGPLPWARMRQAYSLLALCDKFGAGRVEAACQSALAFGVIDVSRIKRMLSNALRPALPTSQDRKVVPLPLPRFARDTKHFETRASKKEEA